MATAPLYMPALSLGLAHDKVAVERRRPCPIEEHLNLGCVAQTLTLHSHATPFATPHHSVRMTSSTMAFLKEEEEQQQGAGPRGSSSRPSTRHEAATAPRDPVAGEDEDDIQSDLVPSANTFIRKLYQMVTNENNDIIAFTPGANLVASSDPSPCP